MLRSLARTALSLTAIAIALALAPLVPAADAQPDPSARWEAEVARFEARDREHPPAKGGIVFAGSSSIRLWDVEKLFPNRAALNRGFGGSQYVDLVAFADRIIVPYEPKVVVLYSGDNDIAGGKSPEDVAATHEKLVRRLREKLPETRTITIGIKPSIQRWALVDKMRAANERIKKTIAQDERQAYIDVEPAMLGDDGLPRPEIFQKDGLHLNAAGYKLWNELLAGKLP
jgi:lysophospholipase L1-like esterase